LQTTLNVCLFKKTPKPNELGFSAGAVFINGTGAQPRDIYILTGAQELLQALRGQALAEDGLLFVIT
jgi:hypothetical protein